MKWIFDGREVFWCARFAAGGRSDVNVAALREQSVLAGKVLNRFSGLAVSGFDANFEVHPPRTIDF